MADVTVAQEEVREIKEWREHEAVRSHPEDQVLSLLLFWPWQGPSYGAGWMRNDETRAKITISYLTIG
jgi:hypothetical protein